MEHFTVRAEYGKTGMTGVMNSEFRQVRLPVSNALWDRFQAWHEAYQPIVPMGMKERFSVVEEIRRLDTMGLRLIEEIQGELGGTVMVEYFSEGLLCELSSMDSFDRCVEKAKAEWA